MTEYTREQAAHDRVAYGLSLNNLTNAQHEAATARRAFSVTSVRSPINKGVKTMTTGLGAITNTDHQTPFDAGIVDEFGNVIADDDGLVVTPIDVTDTDDNGVRTYLLDDDGFPQIGQVDVDGVYDEDAEIDCLKAKAKALEDGV
jgi:hypothetical protein